MAVGLYYYANRPEPYASIPDGLVSHSFEHRDFRRFAGRDVIVIGGGQSGIEFAALLYEAGAAVQVVSRRPINWLPPDRTETRGALARLLAPDAGIAPGWVNWVWDRRPYLFYRFPQSWKDRYNASYPPGANDWLRTRVLGKIALHEGRTVANVDVANGRVAATLSDGARLSADHVLLATGYRVNINRLPMLHASLRAELMTDGANPILNHWFESSIPGLYFVGVTSLRAFGPLYRFVAGCGAAARRVASAIARRGVGRTRTAPRRLDVASAVD